MIPNNITDRIINQIQLLRSGYETSSSFHKDGDFGDLSEIDFSDGSKMGHLSIWSSGNVFFNLFNNDLIDNYEIIPETHIDASEMSEDSLMDHLEYLFREMDNRGRKQSNNPA